MLHTHLKRRSFQIEMMDDLSIQDSRLELALSDLRIINKWLGGYRTSFVPLKAYLDRHQRSHSFTILDIGSGAGDFAEATLMWCHRNYPHLDVKITGIDISPATVAWATKRLSSGKLAQTELNIVFQVASAFEIEELGKSFDIVHCALFMHHFRNDEIVRLIRSMAKVSTVGIIVNDLHRNNLAEYAIKILTKQLGASEMVQHDAPLSVRRSFTKDELTRLASAAGLSHYRVTWHWAFRWLLTTVD